MWQAVEWWFDESSEDSGAGRGSRELQGDMGISGGSNAWGGGGGSYLHSCQTPSGWGWATSPGQELPSLGLGPSSYYYYLRTVSIIGGECVIVDDSFPIKA